MARPSGPMRSRSSWTPSSRSRNARWRSSARCVGSRPRTRPRSEMLSRTASAALPAWWRKDGHCRPMADQGAPAGQGGGKAPQSLDEVMLAMDVVDTLRHQENLVSRELSEEQRDAELLERLRQIYRGQGIEVPDRVLQEGVNALKEQ